MPSRASVGEGFGPSPGLEAAETWNCESIFDNRASPEHEERTIFCEDINASGDSMERRKEAMPISSLDENTLASMETTQVKGSRETPTINLLLCPLGALLVWFLVGGWLYFFGLPVR